MTGSIGAHTVTHPNLSALVADDPEGTALLAEFDENDAEIERELGAAPTDFAFTSTTWSSVAESLVAVSTCTQPVLRMIMALV